MFQPLRTRPQADDIYKASDFLLPHLAGMARREPGDKAPRPADPDAFGPPGLSPCHGPPARRSIAAMAKNWGRHRHAAEVETVRDAADCARHGRLRALGKGHHAGLNAPPITTVHGPTTRCPSSCPPRFPPSRSSVREGR